MLIEGKNIDYIVNEEQKNEASSIDDIVKIDELTRQGSIARFFPALVNFAKNGNKHITGFTIDREREIIIITCDGEDQEWEYDQLFRNIKSEDY